jgi:hypothetical protein
MLKKNIEAPGLCSNCRNVSKCTLRKDHTIPELYCEEFEIGISPSVKAAQVKRISRATVDTRDISGKFIGLCRNCDNRKACSFPKPEGGIWHCEEYR